MGKPKVLDGVKLSIKLPSDDLKRLKIEAIERGTLESSIVLEALRRHWGQPAAPASQPPTGPIRTPRPKVVMVPQPPAPAPAHPTKPIRLSRNPEIAAQQLEEGKRLYALVMARYNSVELGKLLGISDSAIRGWDDCVPVYRWEEVKAALAQPEDAKS